MASIFEKEIRDTVVDKIRQLRPCSRIIHELNTSGMGSPRADLAAIGVDEILLFEIKSERDTLKRLTNQWNTFKECSHATFAVIDEKLLEIKKNTYRTSYDLPEEYKNVVKNLSDSKNLWVYPEPLDKLWDIKFKGFGQDYFPIPNTKKLLDFLWREELLKICNTENIIYKSKDDMDKLKNRIILEFNGKTILNKVCYALRTRKFKEADQEIY